MKWGAAEGWLVTRLTTRWEHPPAAASLGSGQEGKKGRGEGCCKGRAGSRAARRGLVPLSGNKPCARPPHLLSHTTDSSPTTRPPPHTQPPPHPHPTQPVTAAPSPAWPSSAAFAAALSRRSAVGLLAHMVLHQARVSGSN
jgi:hypothetical protein